MLNQNPGRKSGVELGSYPSLPKCFSGEVNSAFAPRLPSGVPRRILISMSRLFYDAKHVRSGISPSFQCLRSLFAAAEYQNASSSA